MADEQLRLRVTAEDHATGPLGRIQAAFRNLASDHGAGVHSQWLL